MKTKHSFITLSYKHEFIHIHIEDGEEIIKVNGKRFRSLRAAKQHITKQNNANRN